MILEYIGIDAEGTEFKGRIKSKSAKVKNFWNKIPESKTAKLPLKAFKCRVVVR